MFLIGTNGIQKFEKLASDFEKLLSNLLWIKYQKMCFGSGTSQGVLDPFKFGLLIRWR